jgi:type II secretory pathway pseudopilin PulG
MQNTMTIKAGNHYRNSTLPERAGEAGFTIIEFLMSSLIFLILASAVLAFLTESQSEASNQIEIQSVLNSATTAMQTIERYLRQAGNDPLAGGIPAITIISSNELRVQSDIKGSCGNTNPNKGDPDGDMEDSDENVIIRFNPGSRSIEILPPNGPPMIIASYISDLTFQYYNSKGALTSDETQVRRVCISITGASPIPNLRTHQIFGVTLRCEVLVRT